ncbi:His-Xaa-Ser system radical SAM maturase HxsB [Candidatus Woesearchaeota archaeon]|nr:His-Xaa-Ser system radical SAM maturase HxsB [Candidatus Woesearchaeota archaeon]
MNSGTMRSHQDPRAGRIPNSYRTRKIGDRYLLTTEHGQWVMLTEKDFRAMRVGKEPEDIHKALYEKGILIDEGNIERITDHYRQKSKFLFNGTSLHILVVTESCNNRCAYCHASAKAGRELNMDRDIAKKTVDFIFQSPTRMMNVEFQGGETLMNFETIKFIVEYSEEKNKKAGKKIEYSIVSNLNTLNDGIIDYCKRHDVNICTSLDGPKEIHDCNRRCLIAESSYERTTQGMKRLTEKGFKPGALTTVTRKSLNDPKGIIDEYVKQGKKSIHLRNVNKLGYAARVWEDVGYSAEEFIEFWKKGMDYILELNKKGTLMTERIVMIFLKKIFTNSDPNYLDIRSPCGAVIGMMSYGINGDIYSCDEGRMISEPLFRIGNVKKDAYDGIIKAKTTASLISASLTDTKFCDTCAYKPYCGICPVLLYAKDNTLIGKITASDKCKIQMAQLDYIFDKLANDKKASEIFIGWLDTEYKGKDLNKHEA